VEGVEDNDSEYIMFKRRMGMREYLKELKMNMQRIKKAKSARSKTKEEKKKKPVKEEESKEKTSTVKTGANVKPKGVKKNKK